MRLLVIMAIVLASHSCFGQGLDKSLLIKIERAYYEIYDELRNAKFNSFAPYSSLDSIDAEDRLKKMKTDLNKSIKVMTAFFVDHDSLFQYKYYVYSLSLPTKDRSYIYYVAEFEIEIDGKDRIEEINRKLITTRTGIKNWYLNVILPYYNEESHKRPKDYPPPPPPPVMIDFE